MVCSACFFHMFPNTGKTKELDTDKSIIAFASSKSKISSAPVHLHSALSAEGPADYVDNGDYRPRVSWYSSHRAGVRYGRCDFFLHNTHLGAIKTTQTTFDFWREFGDAGYTPKGDSSIPLDYEFFKIRGSGAGLGCDVVFSKNSWGNIEVNHASLNQANIQSIHGSVSSSAGSVYLKAQQRKTSLDPYLLGLQAHGSASANWIGITWHYKPEALALTIDVDAPMIWGRVDTVSQAFINTNWNLVSDKNGLVKNSSGSLQIGEYGNQSSSYRIPKIWNVTARFDSSKFLKPIYYVEGIDTQAVHYLGAGWSNWPMADQRYELLIDQNAQSILLTTGSKSWSAGAGFGIRQINGMVQPLMLSYSFRF